MSRNCERAIIAVCVWFALLIILPVSTSEGTCDNEPNLFDLAEKKFRPLSEAEKKLFRKVVKGHLADYSAETEEDNCPGNADKWGRERVLDANSIVWICTDGKASAMVTHKGIQVKGARIDGELDLSYARISFPLDFEKSAFPDGIYLRYAEIRSLYLVGTHTGPIYGDGLKVEGSVYLRDCFTAKGQVNLVGATIGGVFDCNDGKFFNEDRVAIYAGGLNVKEGVFLCNGFMAEGEVNLIGATIAGDLECGNSKFIAPNRYALDADRAKIMGSVFLNDGFTAEGEVRLSGATIGGDLECVKGKFIDPNGYALSADGVNVTGAVYLRNGFKAEGEVDLVTATIGKDFDCNSGEFIKMGKTVLNVGRADIKGSVYLGGGFKSVGKVSLIAATINGDLDCIKGKFIDPNGYALHADRAKIMGSVYLRGGFKSEGKVSLIAATIDGDLECDKGKFIDPNGYALDADRAKIMGSVYLGEGFTSEGEVSLIGATIGGDLGCGKGKFIDPNGYALDAGRAKIEGSVFLSDGFTAEGEVSLIAATIGGDLGCGKGKFIDPNGYALGASRAKIDGSVFLSDGFTAEGEVDLSGATIGGDLSCIGGRFIDPNGYALSANGVNVAGDVFLRKGFKAEGEVDLTGATIGGYFEWWDVNSPNDVTLDIRSARIGVLWDDANSWPEEGKLFLNGLEYKDIAPMDVESRKRWLRLQEGYWPQPYEQLAEVLRKGGQDEDAREVLIAKNQDKAARTELTFVEKCWYLVFGPMIGYGYRPWRALWGVLIFVVLGWILFGFGYLGGLITPESDSAFAKGDKGIAIPGDERKLSDVYPRFNFLIYSVDTFVPLIDLHQSKYWLPNANRGHELLNIKGVSLHVGGLLRLYLWIHIAMGWALSTLLVVGLTGLVRT